jgi:hypothetical protein
VTRSPFPALAGVLLATAIGASPQAPEEPHASPRPVALQPLALHARQIETALA